MASDGGECSHVYGIIGNIPPQYHSSDLRNYFSQFVESGGFDCFHFRHRPETKNVDQHKDLSDTGSAMMRTAQNTEGSAQPKKPKTMCCLVRCNPGKLKELINNYHRKHWLDTKGNSIPALCFIAEIKVTVPKNSSSFQYLTRKEQRSIPADRQEFTEAHLQTLAELNPPAAMPNGNVGTPTKTFLELIRQCKLPPVVIKKLGLTFPKTRSNRRYGDVGFDYGTDVKPGTDDDVMVTASGHDLEGEHIKIMSCDTETVGTSPVPDGDQGQLKDKKKDKAKKRSLRENEGSDVDERKFDEHQSESDDDGGEEWDRHEALYDDVTSQGRTKERLFEERIELKWEKGGSGLVFYTDAQYWQAKEGDFDEQTADDWDVDMSAYYEPEAGDKDALDFIEIRREQRLRAGVEDNTVANQPGIGSFERFSKGIGRRVMEKHGWKDGKGLGSSKEGMADALDNDGQKAWDKTGLGYYGEKLSRSKPPWKKRRRPEGDVIISTVYDDPEDNDPVEPLLRRSEDTGLKYRSAKDFNFVKASSSSTADS